MSKANNTGIILWVIGAFLLSGCFRSPQKHIFSLRPTAEQASFNNLDSAQTVVSLGPISLPQEVDRLQFVTKSISGGEVQISDTNAWAESLLPQITERVRFNLTRHLGKAYWVSDSGSPTIPKKVDLKVKLDINRFDQIPSSFVAISSTWSIEQPSTKKNVLGHSNCQKPVRDDSVEQLVIADSEALDCIAADITTVLKKLSR